jgi:hypothetical protein
VPTFYRIVSSATPDASDFTSNADRGLVLRPPDTLERRRLWAGLSVYRTYAAAVASAARAGWRNGRYLAEIEIATSEMVTVEKTLRDPEHYTVWARPETMLPLVRRVIPIRAAFESQ